MSRKLLSFLLSELDTIRVICKKCGAVVEIGLDKLEETYKKEPTCKVCGQQFCPTNPNDNIFLLLSRMLYSFNHAKSTNVMDLEFALEDKSVS